MAHKLDLVAGFENKPRVYILPQRHMCIILKHDIFISYYLKKSMSVFIKHMHVCMRVYISAISREINYVRYAWLESTDFA